MRFCLIPCLIIGLLLALSSCKKEANVKSQVQKTKQITYVYGDASLPPQYHRSYNIVLTAKEVKISMNSYGKAIGDTTLATDAKMFDEIKALLTKLEITKRAKEGATGYSSHTIILDDNKEKPLLSWRSVDTPNDAVKDFIEKILATVPCFAEMKARPLPE